VKLLKIIAINVITFLVMLAIANWACGVYLKKSESTAGRESLPNYKNDPEHAKKVFTDYYAVKHQYEPFVGWKALPYKGETLNISKEGERLHTPPAENSDGQIIRFYGGSTMWGEGSDSDHTIPALFNRENPEYVVTNHGQLAYNSRQEVDALISMYSRNEKADIVIFYDGVNDAAFLCPKEITELPAHRLVPMYREKLYVGSTQLVRDLMSKIFVENIIKVVYKNTQKDAPENSPYDCLGTPGKAEEIADIMMKNWELAHEIVTSRGGKFIAVLQPAAYVGHPRTDYLTLDQDLGKNFAEVYRQVKIKIKERNHPWVYDLSDKFDGSDYIFIDFCHVSPNGNEIIAKEISKVVKQENAVSIARSDSGFRSSN
jgi:hypothetical protein